MQNAEQLILPRQTDVQQLLAKTGAGKQTLKYTKNQTIYVQGEAADSVFYIQNGRLKFTVISQQGKEAVVGIMEEGQFFGGDCLTGHLVRRGTMRALVDSRITQISKEVMVAALHNQREFSELFIEHLVRRNSRIEEDVIDQLFNSSEKRLARLLLLLANYGKEDSPPIISVILSQETLADMIGTTRSRVSFFMNKFRRLGFIDYNGKIDVHLSLLNAVLHDKPAIGAPESAA